MTDENAEFKIDLNGLETAFNNASEKIFNEGKFDDKSFIKTDEFKNLTSETYKILSSTINYEVSSEFIANMKRSAYVFSGFKAVHEVRQVANLLVDEHGKPKSYSKFQQEVLKIDEKYNKNYLRTEYNFALSSAQNAEKWAEIQADGDRYDLQYRTAKDEKVRAEHWALDGITLPVTDDFWNEYMPPNGYNCRCKVQQVRKGKYPNSDSSKSIKAGQSATSQPKQQIFRFNPGKEQQLLPPKHPYYKLGDKEMEKNVKEELNEQFNKVNPLGTKEIKTATDLSKCVDNLNKSDWFKQGFKEIKTITKKGVNGNTDRKGTIGLKKEIMDNCIAGFENIRNGKACTEDQERSIATLWHEITHNRHKNVGDDDWAGLGKSTKYMEIANEFVARKTLPEFYEALGGEMSFKDFMSNRTNTGYNDWVVKYQNAIEDNKLKEDAVLKSVKDHLFNKRYDDQMNGLINALVNNSEKKITEIEATEIVKKLLK